MQKMWKNESVWRSKSILRASQDNKHATSIGISQLHALQCYSYYL